MDTDETGFGSLPDFGIPLNLHWMKNVAQPMVNMYIKNDPKT